MHDNGLRLRLATRIHFALLRHYDENVEVAALLRGGSDAQEALWVCEASGDSDLHNLALQFQAATRAASEARAGAAPQEAAWARDTSGFGVTRPAEAAPAPAAVPLRPLESPGIRNPLRWLRGAR